MWQQQVLIRKLSDRRTCCGTYGHKNCECRLKDSKCSPCGPRGHLRAVCVSAGQTQRVESGDRPKCLEMLRDKHIALIVNSDGEGTLKQVISKTAFFTNPHPLNATEANGRAQQKVRQVRHLRELLLVLGRRCTRSWLDFAFEHTISRWAVRLNEWTTNHLVKPHVDVEGGGVIKQSCYESHTGKAAPKKNCSIIGDTSV